MEPITELKEIRQTRIGPFGTTLICLLIIALGTLNIIQLIWSTELRVEVGQCELRIQNEHDKVTMFLTTKDLIIRDYWLNQSNDFAQKAGKSLLDANEILTGTIEDMGDE